MRFGFTGYYGMQNYGDDLFVAAVSMAGKEYWGNEIYCLSSEIKGIDTVFLVKSNRKLYSSSSKIAKLYRSFKMLELFRKSDIVLLAGGSTIGSHTSNNMRNFQSKLVTRKVAKLGALGVSIGPFINEEDYKKAKNLISSMEYISVRDKKSYDLVQSMNISTPLYYGRDLAGIIPRYIKVEKGERKNKRLGISLCYYEKYTNGNVSMERNDLNQIISGIKYFLECNNSIEVTIFVLNNHAEIGDQEISNELFEQLDLLDLNKLSVIIHKNDPLDIWSKIGELDMMFTVRLHGAITAYLTQVPFVLFEYHKKCTDFLDDIGYDKKYRLERNIPSPEKVKNILSYISSDKYNVSLDISSYIENVTSSFENAPWIESEIK